MTKKEKTLEERKKDYVKKHPELEDAVQFYKTDSGRVAKQFWYYGLGWRSESFKRRYEECAKRYMPDYGAVTKNCPMKAKAKKENEK